MKSFIPSNTLRRRLMLASAGILLCANGAFAAEFAGDAQIQARDLLSGTVGGEPKFSHVSAANPIDGLSVPRRDPQEQARELILGKSFFVTSHQSARVDSTADAMHAASLQNVRRTEFDGQELAQRMLTGKGA